MLPFLAGVIFWGEYLSPFRVAGFFLLIAALVLPAFEKSESGETANTNGTKIFLLLCLGIFLANGSNSIVAKYHQTASANVDTLSFMVLRETINAPLNAVLFFILRYRNRKQNAEASVPCAPHNNKRFIAINWVVIGAFSIVYSASHFFNLIAARVLDASLQFPVITGGTMVLTAAAGFLLFREKPGRVSSAGIIIALLATVLFGLS